MPINRRIKYLWCVCIYIHIYYTHIYVQVIPLCGPSLCHGFRQLSQLLYSSPLDQFFLYHSISLPPSVSPSLCTDLFNFLLLPHTLFLSSSDFLPSLSLSLSSVLQFPSSSLFLSLSVSLLAHLYYLPFLF